jgi:hypothetical protein
MINFSLKQANGILFRKRNKNPPHKKTSDSLQSICFQHKTSNNQELLIAAQFKPLTSTQR